MEKKKSRKPLIMKSKRKRYASCSKIKFISIAITKVFRHFFFFVFYNAIGTDFCDYSRSKTFNLSDFIFFFVTTSLCTPTINSSKPHNHGGRQTTFVLFFFYRQCISDKKHERCAYPFLRLRITFFFFSQIVTRRNSYKFNWIINCCRTVFRESSCSNKQKNQLKIIECNKYRFAIKKK